MVPAHWMLSNAEGRQAGRQAPHRLSAPAPRQGSTHLGIGMGTMLFT